MKTGKNFEYILFDDTKMAMYGIPIIAVLAPVLFLTTSFKVYILKFHQIFFESVLYTGIIWYCLRATCVFLRKKFPHIDQTIKRNIYQFILAMIVTFFMVKLITLCEKFIYKFCGMDDPFVPEFIVAFLTIAFISLAILVLYEAIYFFKKFKAAVEVQEKLKTAHVQTQLDNLRNQINPHFLFNSLNTLMNLIPKDENKAMVYLDKLSKFYRYSVGKKENTMVSIETELENIKIYVDLLKERFGENISIDINNHFHAQANILPMTLQLLIENAVKHNIVSKNKPLEINIFSSENGKNIHVKNNLQKKIQAVESTGMGLKNIKERFGYFTDQEIECKQTNNSFEVIVPLIINDVAA